MNSLELRNTVLQYVQSADERLLGMLKALSESYTDSDIVAYSTEGKPLTRSHYKKSLLKAEKEVIEGDFTTQEDLEKEIENW